METEIIVSIYIYTNINPKGNQSWIFTGWTDAEVEAPVLWSPYVKNQLIGKDPDAGKDWGQEEKGMTEDEMVGWDHLSRCIYTGTIQMYFPRMLDACICIC